MLQQKKKQTLRRHLQVFHILKNYLAQRSRRERERERENICHTCVPTYGLLGSITSLKFKREQSLHIYWV